MGTYGFNVSITDLLTFCLHDRSLGMCDCTAVIDHFRLTHGKKQAFEKYSTVHMKDKRYTHFTCRIHVDGARAD